MSLLITKLLSMFNLVPTKPSLELPTNLICKQLVEAYYLMVVLKLTYEGTSQSNKVDDRDLLRALYQMLLFMHSHPTGNSILQRSDGTRKRKKKQINGKTQVGFGIGAFDSILEFSCQPNVVRRFDGSRGCIEYHVIQLISAGEVLTIDWGLPDRFKPGTDRRRLEIDKRFKVLSDCHQCGGVRPH